MFVPDNAQDQDSAIRGLVFGEDADYYARQRPRPSEFDMDKVYTTIKQFVRDWSVEVCAC